MKELSREERIATAFNAAPKNTTEERECLALGVTIMVNADMLKMLHEDSAAQRDRIAEQDKTIARLTEDISIRDGAVQVLNAALAALRAELETTVSSISGRDELADRTISGLRVKLEAAEGAMSGCPRCRHKKQLSDSEAAILKHAAAMRVQPAQETT